MFEAAVAFGDRDGRRVEGVRVVALELEEAVLGLRVSCRTRMQGTLPRSAHVVHLLISGANVHFV